MMTANFMKVTGRFRLRKLRAHKRKRHEIKRFTAFVFFLKVCVRKAADFLFHMG